MKNKLNEIKAKFYFKDGEPNIDHYGIFNMGLTSEEVKDYVIVRANTTDSKKLAKYNKKINDLGRGSTCPLVVLDGKHYPLFYRHDIKHYCDVVFNNAIYVMD